MLEGIFLSEFKKSIGLRDIQLVQSDDDHGKSFKFRVNGIDLFIKGGNYIPPDMFMPRVTK